jgi:hypothetical protein
MDLSPTEWFRGAAATTDGEALFVQRLRQLAEGWHGVDLSAAGSMGASWASRPLAGLKVPHVSAPVNWLWVLYLEDPRTDSLECSWGDDTRFNDWGPIDGNVYSPHRRFGRTPSATTPENAAKDAATWLLAQSRRDVRRDEWEPPRSRKRWTFTDTGATLFDTAPRAHRNQAPDSTDVEHPGS